MFPEDFQLNRVTFRLRILLTFLYLFHSLQLESFYNTMARYRKPSRRGLYELQNIRVLHLHSHPQSIQMIVE